MLKIDVSKKSKKFLLSIPPKHSFQIDKKLFSLREDPFPSDSKKLSGYADYYRVDSGEYRIIYHLNSDGVVSILYIDLIGKRNDGEVYKKFSRSNN